LNDAKNFSCYGRYGVHWRVGFEAFSNTETTGSGV